MATRLRATTALAAVGIALLLAVVLIVERRGEASMSDAFTPTPTATDADPQATSCLQALREPSLGLRPIAFVADCERINIGGSASVTPGETSGTTPNRTPTSTPTPSQTRTPAPARTPTPTQSQPAGQRKVRAYITGFSYFDNTPPGSAAISHPILHASAAGTGTYADPITVAVGHSIINGKDILDWPAGTRFYVPNLRRYFIVEDTCGNGSRPQDGPCHTGYPASATTWLDVWVGGKGGSESGSDACMNAITNTWDVLVNPGPNYATVAGSIYGSGGCTKQYGNTIVLS